MKKIILLFITTTLCFGLSNAQDVLSIEEMNSVYKKETHLNKRVQPYPPIRQSDMMHSRKIWREIDLRQKINHPLYYPENDGVGHTISDRKSLIDVIYSAIKEGSITAYGNAAMDDEFREVMSQDDIKKIEKDGNYLINESITIDISDVEITSKDIPGCIVATNNGLTVALDVTLSDELREEGLAREFINRIQNLRKDSGFEVTDKVKIQVEKNDSLTAAIKNNFTYICDETLAVQLDFEEHSIMNGSEIELIDNISTKVLIIKN